MKMWRWIAAVVPALVVAVALTADGLAQQKNTLSKGTRDTGTTSDPRGSVTTANRSGVPITFLGADGEGGGSMNLSDNTGEGDEIIAESRRQRRQSSHLRPERA